MVWWEGAGVTLLPLVLSTEGQKGDTVDYPRLGAGLCLQRPGRLAEHSSCPSAD